MFAGKLGHGDTNRVYRPKVIEALHGFIIRKVCAGSQSSLALTSTGQVGRLGRSLRRRPTLYMTRTLRGPNSQPIRRQKELHKNS